MTKQIKIAILYTIITAVLLGIVYPFAVTGVARMLFRNKADGQLISQNGRVIGSRIIGQPFTGPRYFNSRPSAAGAGYDATSSGGSNLAATSKTLVDRVNTSAAAEHNSAPPVDLVTASGSGLDPDISPASALYQVPGIARERKMSEDQLRQLVESHITPRQLGLLGEPRVNVLELNLALDAASTH